jgi:hypothetical protein
VLVTIGILLIIRLYVSTTDTIKINLSNDISKPWKLDAMPPGVLTNICKGDMERLELTTKVTEKEKKDLALMQQKFYKLVLYPMQTGCNRRVMMGDS